KPLKWFSIGQFFRYEKQQRGRLREHYQLNCDIIGEPSIDADIELISVCIDVLRAFGLTENDVVVRISDRDVWTSFLRSKGVAQNQWEEILQIIDKSERRPRAEVTQRLGVLADSVFDIFANSGESEKLEKVIFGLRARGLVDFAEIDLRIVRGLAYY